MFSLESIYTSDHDSMAGYGGRIGYRYKTTLTIKLPAKYWNNCKKVGLGGLVIDVKNAIYNAYGFKQTYYPQVDTKARAKKGFTVVTFDFFHNSDEDAIKAGYDVERGFLKHHKRAAEKQGIKYNPSQYELDPNNN